MYIMYVLNNSICVNYWSHHNIKMQASGTSRPVKIPRQQIIIYWKRYQHTHKKGFEYS